MDMEQMRTWAEIDLGRLKENYRSLRALAPCGCQFVGVVKANAYGHGALPVARALETVGAECLAVACLDEAEELRAGGISAPILILGHTPPEFGRRLLALKVTQCVGDLATARALSALAVEVGTRLRVHVKADTGMSRLGFLADEAGMATAAEEIAALCALPGLLPEGIFTHFSDADGSQVYTMRQLDRFLSLTARLEDSGVQFGIRHCAASAAVLNYPCTHLDMIRPGIALYGHAPAPGMEKLCPLRPVMNLKTCVAAVRDLPEGTAVSYGRTHTLTRPTRLAVLPVGYADGFTRLLSNRARVLLHGMPVPIVGRICMDLCMADVTDLPQVVPGDVATLYGDGLPVEEAAEAAGTIAYELLCAVSGRVPRVYLPEGK